VKGRTAKRLFGAIVSTVVVLAWLAASNHCAVAGLLPAPSAAGEHEHCPGHEAPAKQDKDGGCDGQNCCKSLSVPFTALAKNQLTYDATSFLTAEYPATSLSRLSEQRDAPILELDTGPPGPCSFAELVLQRSVLAHAPPLFA
jgi:hypothetical protein